MFDVLSQKLGSIFKKLGVKGRLSEKDIDEALRQIRLALLEADVNFKVVKELIARVREQSLTTEVLESLTPAQQIVTIVKQEIGVILGGGQSHLVPSAHPPSIAMLVGLQGSGKTTTAAKLALHLNKQGHSSLLVAADTRRPAAIEQLILLGQQSNIPVYNEDTSVSPATICAHAMKRAKEIAASWVIIDTGGRLHIDQDMMKELAELRAGLQPAEVLLVVDAMTGQDAVRAAEEFNASVKLTGLILTKIDGDARGGAALSITSTSGVPIKFMGTGEKTEALEPFHPDRLASRILGMGDMATLIEKAESAFDKEQAKEIEKKVRSAELNLEDFLSQLEQIKKMGPLSQLIEMIPGLSSLSHKLPEDAEEKQLKKMKAMIQSMTPEERRNPDIIDGHRRHRIALGSGTTPQDINQLLNQFRQMQKLAKQIKAGKKYNLLTMLR